MNVKMILMGACFVVAVMGASVGSSVYVAKYMIDQQMAPIESEEGGDPAEIEKPPVYVELDPFIVNFVQEEALRYLQLTVQLMSRNESISEVIDAYKPQIRNQLILVLSGHPYKQLVTREGKETIRQEILDEVNRILGDAENIESVFLTGFVMQ